MERVLSWFGSLDYLPRLMHLALPIAVQSLMMTLLNLIDTVMVGQLGEVEIGAIALGNQIFFLLFLFMLGVGSGGAVFAAQFWGRGDIAGVRMSLGMSLFLGTAGAAIFSVLALALPEQVLALFSTDDRVILEGSSYLRVVGLSYVFTGISLSFSYSLRSIGDTRLPMYATLVSIGLNIVGNYVLIFGKLGFPAMGVTGAAVSTAIARVVELALILGVVYRRRGPLAARITDLIPRSREFVRRFLSRALPVIANEILWSTGFTMYTLVFGRMGTGYLAAYNISDTVARLMLVVFFGTGQASAILIGNTIGAGRQAEALLIGRSIMRVTLAAAAGVGLVVFFGVAPVAPLLFSVTASTRVLITQFLRLFAILMVLKVSNIHVIVGVLRGGGDTRFALAIDIIPLWLIGVPAAVLTGLVFGVSAPLVYLCLNFEELTRFVVGRRRVATDRWIHDVTGAPSPDLQPAP